MQNLPELLGPSGEEFPRERVFPYAFRHSFAQRHADHGTPIDVLSEMMGHRTMDTTRGYYKVNKTRMRKAVATVSEMQLNHRGHRVTANLAELVDAEYDRYQVGQIAVAFGTCHEPSNVKSSGQSCPYRFRCFGCTHFRTDPSYLPELREHLQRLLVDHERLNTATGGMLEDWARRDALPAPEEIVAVRRLIRTAEAILDGLTAEERASVDELFAVIRRARANIDAALPTHFTTVVRQPRPTLYPRSASGSVRVMNESRTAAATARRRADSDHKRQRVLTVAGAFIDRGQDFSLEQLARAAQVNPGFVHRAPGLKAEIEALRHDATVELEAGLRTGTALTTASLKAENTFLKQRLHDREQDVATLKRRLGEALGQTMLRLPRRPDR